MTKIEKKDWRKGELQDMKQDVEQLAKRIKEGHMCMSRVDEASIMLVLDNLAWRMNRMQKLG